MKNIFNQFMILRKKKFAAKGLIICLMMIVFSGISMEAFSQLEDKSIKDIEKELFFLDPIVFYNKEQMKARLDVYIEIPLSNLQFKKNYSTKNYDAKINYEIKITNSANEVVTNESITDFVSTTKAEQKTLDDAASFIVKEFYLNPGKYALEVTLSDMNTNKEKVKKGQVTIADYSQKEISFSDIMLVSNLKEENGKKVITPLIDKNIDNLKEIYLFFEIYNSQTTSTTNNYSYSITDSKNKILEKGDYKFTLVPGTNKFFEKIATTNLVFGDYKLSITDNSNGQLLAEKEFSNKLNGIPVNMKDLKLLIDQLIYIASGDEMAKIQSAKNDEESEKYFIEFWRSRDPSQGTNKNELMIEYYKRIRIANERYSHYIDGWKTDMGMVFIIFGEPSNIERYPFTENTKPYEIWQFYNENKEFIFVDETGFGDYKLMTPIWDERGTKIRN